MSDPDEEIDKLNAAIAGLEAQRATLGDVVAPAVTALREQLSRLEAASAGGAMDDERKIVTIVFADISGFTALSEKMDPEDVRTIMNGCFEFLVPVVKKYEGTIDKFIGDEIMALFGAPAAHENDPERALRVALEMMDALAAFNLKHGTSLGLHIGINTGPVIAGKIGAHDRGDYSVLGDAVNLAARLEDASSSGEIFVGLNTYRQTKRLFDFEKIPPLNLKGKEAPVEVYRLLGFKAVPESARGIEGLRAPLIGRGSELEEIRSALTALKSGRGCILAITGEAGLGKSRLIAEAQALSSPDISWSVGRALPYTAGMSYWVARDLLYSLLNVKADDPPFQIDEVLQRELQDEIEDIYPYLARFLELPMETAAQERVKFLTGEVLQERILQAFRDYVAARAMRQPLVLVWEDLHWCDPSSLQVFETLSPLTTTSPLLLLSASRPDETVAIDLLAHARQTYAADFRSVELSPLTRTESESLIQDLLKIENLPEKVRDLIVGRAEGNPFFLEELLRSLIDAGHIVLEESGAVAADRIETVDIPETVQGVLMARIDRLQPDHKRALQKASVVGRIFQSRVLTHLYESNSRAARSIDRSLAELQRREFIQSHEQEASGTSAVPDEYIFRHAITHHVAYQSLLMAHRKELHKLAAEALETLFPDRLEELSAALGYHYECAAVPEQAAHHLGRAAERAQATFANTEALAFYRSAIAQIESIEVAKRNEPIQNLAARLNEGMGDVLTLMCKHGDARAAFDQALSFIADTNAVWRSRLFRKIGFSHDLQRHYKETSEAFDAAEEQLGAEESGRQAEWWEEKMQIQLERMHLLYWQGMSGEMRELAKRYRSAIQERGTPIQRGKFFEKLALSYLTESRYQPDEECLKLAELACSESLGSDSLPEVAHIRFVLGFVHLWRGNFAEAVEHCAATLHLAERFGDLVIQARSLTYLAVAHRCAHQLDQARTCAAQTLELATRIGMSEYIAMAKANLAWVAWREGNHAETEKLGCEALKLWHEMDDPYSFDWMALWPLIATRFAQNDIAGAIQHTEELLNPKQHPLPQKLAAATRQALASWQKGEAESARDELAHAIQTAHEAGYL